MKNKEVKVVYQGQSQKQEKAKKLWRKVVADFNPPNPMTAIAIAKKYKIGRSTVYFILDKAKKGLL